MLGLNFFFFFLHFYSFNFCEGEHATACMLRSEGNLGEPVLSFDHVGLGDQTHVVRFGGMCLYLLSNLAGLQAEF